jgi:putative ATP-dependent endonuclease of OLD family
MHLAFVGIDQYRGISSLELPLDETTTLIGENAYGKSNLLDALLVCLGAGADDGRFAFLPEDFRPIDPADEGGARLGPPEGPVHPIDIRLGFRETRDDEWQSEEDCAILRGHVHRGRRGDRRLTLRVRATLRDDRATVDVACSFIDGAGRIVGGPVGVEAIELLRRRSPFLLVKSDRYFTRPSRLDRRAHEPGATRPLALEERLAQEVTEAYQSLGGSRLPPGDAEMLRGVEAAKLYVERFGGARLRERVQHFLPASPAGSGRTGGTGVSLAARSIALMIVLGGLLDARGQALFGHGAMPTVAIEDIEAHIHPVLLASIAAVVHAIPAQKILTTNSGELLSMMPLPSLRRLVRRPQRIEVHRLGTNTLSDDELRRVRYHVKANRGSSLFARCWLFVEGETEFWLLPHLAEALGADFALEGIRMMEFAQCGVEPLVKLADDLGIPWHILCDGDAAGRSYAETAASCLAGRPARDHITRLDERDIEHCLWHNGYAHVYRDAVRSTASRRTGRPTRIDNPTPTIERAVRARSKPGMAIAVADAALGRGSPGVPPILAAALDATVRLARG